MSGKLVDRLARALLYEGYVLYPYRPSVKNMQRWTFGGVYPRAWSESQTGTDFWTLQTECLVSGSERTRVRITVRFLHLLDRKTEDQASQSWQEAEEREIDPGEMRLGELIVDPARKDFAFAGRRVVERVRSDAGEIGGILIREQQSIIGAVEVSSVDVAKGLYKLTVRVINETELEETGDRNQALMRSFASTHTILGIEEGEFISTTDPPDELRSFADQCRNIGVWPVLVGTGTEHDTILSSPIILSDYPQLAPESPGDLFDSTEIDEILTLRILTLTDDEKREAAGVDHRVRDLLSRTESLARDQLMNLHGTMRGLRPVPQEQSHE